MTEIEEKISDFILKKVPANTPFSFDNLVDSLIKQIKETPELSSFTTFIWTNASTIRTHLLNNGYIECIDTFIPQYRLLDAGKKAKELGGHRKYLDYLKKQNRKTFVTDFPKNYWYVVAIFAALFGFFTDVLKDNLKNTKTQTLQQDTTQLKQTIVILQDSIHDLVRQQKEFLNVQKIDSTQHKIK